MAAGMHTKADWIGTIDILVQGITDRIGSPYLDLMVARNNLLYAERLLEKLAVDEYRPITDYAQHSLILTTWNYLNQHKQNFQYH